MKQKSVKGVGPETEHNSKRAVIVDLVATDRSGLRGRSDHVRQIQGSLRRSSEICVCVDRYQCASPGYGSSVIVIHLFIIGRCLFIYLARSFVRSLVDELDSVSY